MEYTIKLNEKATMIINIDGPELYRGQKAENLARLENISELIKEVLKSRHNDITITEYAEKPSPELLAIVKERGECGKGRYENPELELDLEWDYKVFKGSIGKYSYNDPFIREGGVDTYLMLGKYAAVFTDYEDTMEYNGEKRIITKFFNGGHSVKYLAEESLENLKVPDIGKVREDLFKKIDRFKELAERYTIQGISDSFDTTVRNFEELINKNYGKGEEE